MYLDLVIIGAGPAGIAACLYASRQKLNFVCISKDIGGLANYIPNIGTYLGYHYLSGYDLVKKFQEHMKDYEVNVRFEGVEEIKKTNNEFMIRTDAASYVAKAVIITTGRRFKWLNVPGEKEFEGKGVSHCAACDGPLFKDKSVAVIGGGKSGLLSSLYMMKYVKRIHIFEFGPKLGGIETWRKAIELAPNIDAHVNAEITEIFGDETVKGIRVKEGNVDKTYLIDGVFVEIGYSPNTDMVKDLVKLDDRGYIVIDKNNMSSVPGIFAAGDITDVIDKQVVIAVGDGSKAALAAQRFIEHATTSTTEQSIIPK